MKSYIVRIYREGRQRLLGVVEEVGGKDKRAFTDRDELWSILHGAARRRTTRPSGANDVDARRPPRRK